MITTFDELIRFLEDSSDFENAKVGLTTYDFTMIEFTRRLSKEDEKALKEIAEKYKIDDDMFEISETGISFEVDKLVYLGNERNDMRKLISFLKELNQKIMIKSFATGIDFKLREV
jgi:hypothetical protein